MIVELHTPQDAHGLAATVSDLYRAVFALPPFLGNEDEFRSQQAYYPELTQRPGFQLATARAGSEYFGFVYGYLLPPDTRWWDGLSGDLPREFIEENGSRTFAVIDFGVLAGRRDMGTGRTLHDAILSASGAERATLTVQEKASDTQAIYRHWGWRAAARRSATLGGVPVTFDVYVRPISA